MAFFTQSCPRCRSPWSHPARREGHEKYLAFLPIRPFRCERCNKRFYACIVSFAALMPGRQHLNGITRANPKRTPSLSDKLERK